MRRMGWLGTALLGLLSLSGGAGAVDAQLRKSLGQTLDRPQPAADPVARQVWWQDYRQRVRPFLEDPQRRQRLVRMVFTEARRADIPPGLVFAVIEVESAFNRFAISSAGARGLMQIMPFWREEIGRPQDNLFRPRINLRYGCTILRYYLDQEDGDILQALAAYNGSTGRTIYPRKIQRVYRQRWNEPN